jgi:hypothetical protein
MQNEVKFFHNYNIAEEEKAISGSGEGRTVITIN